MRGKKKFAFMAFMVRHTEPHSTDSCRVGDLFKTKADAEKAIKATWAWHVGRFNEMEIYRQLVSRDYWEKLPTTGQREAA